MHISGRVKEQRILHQCLESESPEFVVVYGRRRVGKTFLVREFFKDRFCFRFTGLANGTKEEQLREFGMALSTYGSAPQNIPADWFAAFAELRKLIEQKEGDEKKVIFLDEMPWMDTHKSRFLVALEAFWNAWAAGRADILLIVCGSSTSWITRKLFRHKGGLHNRVTRRLQIRQFSLMECEQFLSDRGLVFSRQDIVDAYMVFGGVPYYLSLFEKGYSVPQNIDMLCFQRGGQLTDEFHELFASLFVLAQRHIEVIGALSKKTKGLTREEIIANTRISDGGVLSKILEELEQSDFIRKYNAFGKTKRGALYQLCDPFTLFYLKFMKDNTGHDENFWKNNMASGARLAWSGYAFEQVCLAHIDQIKARLGILGVLSSVSSWRSSHTEPGAQIDLVIDRSDRVINLCEIKYSDRVFEITKTYDENLRNKRSAFISETGTRKAIHTTMITTYGVKPNAYKGSIQSEVVMDDLFS